MTKRPTRQQLRNRAKRQEALIISYAVTVAIPLIGMLAIAMHHMSNQIAGV